MKIVSWNIAGGHTFLGGAENVRSYEKEDLDYFINILKEVGADVVCLQETHTPTDGKPYHAQVIAQELGYGDFINHTLTERESHIKEGYYSSISTLSRFPIKTSRFHALPNPNLTITRPNGELWISYTEGILLGEINYNGVGVNIANILLIPFHYFERDFAEPEFNNIREEIVRVLLSLLDKPVLAIGDYNLDNLKKYFPELFENKKYIEAFENIETAPGRGQQDHILYSHQWSLKEYGVNKEVNADHYLCSATLDLKE